MCPPDLLGTFHTVCCCVLGPVPGHIGGGHVCCCLMVLSPYFRQVLQPGCIWLSLRENSAFHWCGLRPSGRGSGSGHTVPPFLTSSLGYYGLDVPTVLCICLVVYGELVLHSLPKLCHFARALALARLDKVSGVVGDRSGYSDR